MTLKQLNEHFHSALVSGERFENLHHLVSGYKSSDWMQYVHTSQSRYHREKIFSCSTHEMFIITWNVNQGSYIHDHSENGCWMKVLRGELEETVYSGNLRVKQNNHLRSDDIGFMKNSVGLHSIKNASDYVVVSLHIYSPPNHSTNFFYIHEGIEDTKKRFK